MFQSRSRNLGWQNSNSTVHGGGQGAVELLKETTTSGAGDVIFLTTKDFIGVPEVFSGSDLVAQALYSVSGTNEITFVSLQDEGTQITISYLAAQ